MRAFAEASLPPTYSTPEVARRAGVTFRRIDYWLRAGMISCSVPATGSGSDRVWTFEDLCRVHEVVAAVKLVDGLDPRGARGSGGFWR